MFYNIVTFGCQMNIHESEKIAGMLENMGYLPTDDKNKADVIIFNTCAIREGAEDRALGNIGALKKMKKNNPSKIIAVAGCMTQQEKVASRLFKTFPFIDIIIGTHNLNDLPNLINKKILEKNDHLYCQRTIKFMKELQLFVQVVRMLG